MAESTLRDVAHSSRAISVSGLPASAVNFDFDRPLKLRRVAGKTLAQAPVQFRIVRFPHFVADMNAVEINVAVAEAQFGVSSPGILNRGS